MTQTLDKLFFNPLLLHSPKHLSECIAALSEKACPNPRSALSTSLMGRLFLNRDSSTGVGMDLASINIQRGRDHGLPGYNRFRLDTKLMYVIPYIHRTLCGKKQASSFSDLKSVMSKSKIQALRSVYQHVDDIDLFVGGLLEKRMPGGLLGQTFSCIVADQVNKIPCSIINFDICQIIQMFRTMMGDRFFYSLSNTSNPFTKG